MVNIEHLQLLDNHYFKVVERLKWRLHLRIFYNKIAISINPCNLWRE